MRILIAEGNLALATFLQRSFQDEHYLVDLAADGTKRKFSPRIRPTMPLYLTSTFRCPIVSMS